MKRIAFAAICALGWFACSTQNLAPPAQIQGANGLALVGHLLFISSTETNEIKVLDVGGVTRDFVRAPNPLEPLSISVVDRPIDLARDINYDAHGAEVVGPYLYVRGQSSAAVSIIGSDPATQLVELQRVLTSGVVTAIAARGPVPGGTSGNSTLYFATADTPRCQFLPDAGQCPPEQVTRATLWGVVVPPADAHGRLPAPVTPMPLTVFNTVVTSIVVMPTAPNLAIATRTLPVDGGQSQVSGRTVIFNPLTNTVVRELPFPSSVRHLVTNPQVEAAAENSPGSVTVDAGEFLYGILDEAFCGTATACPAVVAVDTNVGVPDGGIPDGGLLANDSAGLPMIPLNFGAALPMALSLSKLALVPVPNLHPENNQGTYTRVRQSLVGYVPTSNGNIYLFDAVTLQPLNVGAVIDGGPPTAGYFAADGGPRFFVEGPVNITTQIGKARDEIISSTYQGIISGLQDLTGADGGAAFPFPVAFSDRPRVQDTVVLSGTGCPDYSDTNSGLIVLAIDAGILFTDGGVPAGCSLSTYSVRAAGDLPYVVFGSFTGYMGRTGPNMSFSYHGTFWFRPCPASTLGCDLPSRDNDQLTFMFGAGDPAIQREWYYNIQSTSSYIPEFMELDTSGALFGTINIRLPTNVVNVTTLPDGGMLDRFYVAYPSGNSVIEFDPTAVTPNVNAVTGVAQFN